VKSAFKKCAIADTM